MNRFANKAISHFSRREFITGTSAFLLCQQAWAAPHESKADVVILGGGVGGCAAALAALSMGMKVTLTNTTDWIGGQLTAQAVPPDEHPWIERFGRTARYAAYREGVRQFYRDHLPLTEDARKRPALNPGDGTVSALTHEFHVSVMVLTALFEPYLKSGALTLHLNTVPVAAATAHDAITSVTIQNTQSGHRTVLQGQYFLDATELGDVLQLANVEHVTGAEAKSSTNELHASDHVAPANSQSFTYCFALDFLPGEDHTIDQPRDYSFWRDYVPKLQPAWTGKLFDWTAPSPRTLAPVARTLGINQPPDRDFNLWTFRRIANKKNFRQGAYPSDITLVNWPMVDFWEGDLVTANDMKRKELCNKAKQQSLSFLYWLQKDAPNPDGGTGFRGVRLRKDIVGTADGLAKEPYIRESRRIQSLFTVKEEHVGTEMRMAQTGASLSEVKAAEFHDSVGVGAYRIDLHPTAGGTNYIDVGCLPFQIPLGALIPIRFRNLLPACKNIGTTHITNGCYRLHPVEWNIGESAGALAAFCIAGKYQPHQVRAKAALLADFQQTLRKNGVELSWPKNGIHPL